MRGKQVSVGPHAELFARSGGELWEAPEGYVTVLNGVETLHPTLVEAITFARALVTPPDMAAALARIKVLESELAEARETALLAVRRAVEPSPTEWRWPDIGEFKDAASWVIIGILIGSAIFIYRC
jgi:hypothetical protein